MADVTRSRDWTSLGSVAGVGVAIALWLGLARILPSGAAAGASERLGIGLAALLPSVCILNLMILVQMWLRARKRVVDPLAGPEPVVLQVNQRVLTNTVEQLAGFAPALLSLAAGVASGRMGVVVAAGLVFALARLTFWVGYLVGPLTRAPGMAATFAINVSTLAAALSAWWP
jgi:hypothetical protein